MPSAVPSGALRDLGFRALLGAHFCGALNDNLFKMIVSLLAVGVVAGEAVDGTYLSLAGGIFILPYLLFSAVAGRLADRMSRRRLLVAAKAIEVAVMLLALVALLWGRIEGMLAVLFLLATQAAFLAPAKYALLPELLPASALGRANGIMEMSRYLAIILGTVAGGAVLNQWREAPAVIAVILIIIAVAGWAASVAVPEPAGPRPNAIRTTPVPAAVGLGRLPIDNRLGSVAAGLIYFDLFSAFVMMDVLLLAKESLRLDDLASACIGGLVGIGLGLGCGAAGRLCRRRVPARLVLVGNSSVAIGLAAAWVLGASATGTAIAMLVVGAFGGLFVVPLVTLLQRLSRPRQRGRVVAAVNFFGMAGVLLATALLWLLHDAAGMPARDILLLAAGAALAASAVIWRTQQRSSASSASASSRELAVVPSDFVPLISL